MFRVCIYVCICIHTDIYITHTHTRTHLYNLRKYLTDFINGFISVANNITVAPEWGLILDHWATEDPYFESAKLWMQTTTVSNTYL